MNSLEKIGDILLHPNDHKRKGDWVKILRFMDVYIPYTTIQTSLDLGSGLGDISYHIVQKNGQSKAICIDADERFLKEAAKRSPNITPMRYDINEVLPMQDSSIDLVSCLGTLHYPYTKNPQGVISEMVRVSKKYVMVDFLYKYRMWYFLLKLRHPNYNPRRYTDKEIKDILKRQGLKIIASVGTRNPFGTFFSSFGRTTIFLLEKTDASHYE